MSAQTTERWAVGLLAVYGALLPWWNTGATMALLLLAVGGVVRLRTVRMPVPRTFWPLGAAWAVAAGWAFFDGGWAPVLRWLPWLLLVPALAPWSAHVRNRGLLLGVAGGFLYLALATVFHTAGVDLPTGNPVDPLSAGRVATSRAFGGVGHQHIYWALYAFLGGLAVATSSPLPRWAKASALLALLVLTGWGGSKMGIAAVVAGGWLWLGMHPAGRPWRWGLRLGLVALGVAAVVLFVQPTDGRFQQERLLHPKPEWATGSFETRSVQWQAAVRLWSDAPLWGRGAASKQDLLQAEYHRLGYWFGEKRRLNVHNTYLEFLLAYGWMGAAAVLAAVLAAFWVGLRQKSAVGGPSPAHRASTWALAAVLLLVALTESLTERVLGVHLIGWYAYLMASGFETPPAGESSRQAAQTASSVG